MSVKSRDRLVALVSERFADRKFVVVANREPLVHERDASGKIRELHPASGMSTALAPIVDACRGVWVAHGSGSADFDVVDEKNGLPWPEPASSGRLRRVRLSSEVEAGYYYGLSNEGLWPLCHIAYTAPLFRRAHWEKYVAANRAFADAVLDEIGAEPAVVFIQDYHLGLLPRLLRKERPDILIAHFWHIPWPNREVFRVFPWSDSFLAGMLGSDLVGFHVPHHCNNFLDTIDRGIEALVDPETRSATREGHPTFVRAFPISIDVEDYAEIARTTSFEETHPELAAETKDKLLLLGVDRLDYTKGIPHRVRIFESLLQKRPDLRGRAVFVQIGAPTRTAIGRYAALAREVQALVDEVNRKYGKDGWLPIRYIPEHTDRDRLACLYRRADACLVTPLHDGMNLVAKEYVAAHAGEPGTLMLSKFTGAARELLEACLVNPYDVETSAEMLAESLDLDAPLRAEAMSRLYQRVLANDVYDWAFHVMRALDDIARRHEASFFPGN
ncbi:MAG TPA: trehalose-6-phosphate synthase [Polyangiaceae bacterium]